MQIIEYKAFRYYRQDNAFLSVKEVTYSLKRFWCLVGGGGDWKGSPVINFLSVSKNSVQEMLDLSNNSLSWVPMSFAFPGGNNVFDCDRYKLPSICRIANDSEMQCDEVAFFPLDLISATFFMLSRYEEYCHDGETDIHGRFRLEDSFAYKQNFHQRPIIDEWALAVRKWLAFLHPQWEPIIPNHQPFITHDIDIPIRYSSVRYILRAIGGELIQRSRNPIKALGVFIEGVTSLFNVYKDPYVRKLKELLYLEQLYKYHSACFIMASEPGKFDRGYRCDDPKVKVVLEIIDGMKAELGWHPGYRTFNNEEIFQTEKHKMDAVLEIDRYGGRQHYLRWKAGVSWETWEKYGLIYDSTLGWANSIGFRCGTCHPYPCFSIKEQRTLSLIERPLIIMDTAAVQTSDTMDGIEKSIIDVLQRVRLVNGEAVILLHNSFHNNFVEEIIYKTLGMSEIHLRYKNTRVI